MSVFQHNGPAVEGRMSIDLLPVDKTAVVVINQVKVVALTRVIANAEISDELILGINVLHQEIGREFGTDHYLSLHIDRMDIKHVIGFPVREGQVVEFISGG